MAAPMTKITTSPLEPLESNDPATSPSPNVSSKHVDTKVVSTAMVAQHLLVKAM